jgi:hypothetical protein
VFRSPYGRCSESSASQFPVILNASATLSDFILASWYASACLASWPNTYHSGINQINTITSDAHPGGYIVSNADDLLGLFDADYGMLVIGEGAKILGPNTHGQEILTVAEYLRLKQFRYE